MNKAEWLKSNSPQIQNSLDAYATDHVFYGKRKRRDYILSDYGLCGAVRSGRVPLPDGYTVNYFSVSGGNGFKREPHYAGYNGSYIWDVVAGQFYRNDMLKLSGIGIMLSLAPSLFIKLTDEVIALHATALQIKTAFGLNYELS